MGMPKQAKKQRTTEAPGGRTTDHLSMSTCATKRSWCNTLTKKPPTRANQWLEKTAPKGATLQNRSLSCWRKPSRPWSCSRMRTVLWAERISAEKAATSSLSCRRGKAALMSPSEGSEDFSGTLQAWLVWHTEESTTKRGFFPGACTMLTRPAATRSGPK